MANHKSAIKAHKQSLKSRAKNLSILSRVKTFVKKYESSLLTKEVEKATENFRNVESEIMKATSKGIYKLNTAARKVSRLAKKLKAIAVK